MTFLREAARRDRTDITQTEYADFQDVLLLLMLAGSLLN